MDQLIAKIAANAGIDPAVARKALAIVIGFLQREGPSDQVGALMDKISGARELAAEAPAGSPGLMGVFNDLTAAGLNLGAVQTVTRDFVDHARSEAGDGEVNAVIGAIPGLSQFV